MKTARFAPAFLILPPSAPAGRRAGRPVAIRILAVDDEEHVRRLLHDALATRGYEVETASDGTEAARKLNEREFDIVVTDLQMPRMDGRRLAQIAGQIRPGVGLIIMTAHPSESSVLDTFRHGAAAYLVKPVDLRDLFRAVKEVERERSEITGKLGGAPGGAGPGGVGAARTGSVRIESPRSGWVEFEAPSHQLYVERFTNLFHVLLRRGLSEDTLDDVRIAVQEIGANAVEWGNEGDVRKPIRISALIEPEQLVLVIEDQGRGFRPEVVPDPTKDPEAVAEKRRSDGKRAGGYGIAMARAAMDEVIYNRAGNTVVMTKRLRSAEKPTEGPVLRKEPDGECGPACRGGDAGGPPAGGVDEGGV